MRVSAKERKEVLQLFQEDAMRKKNLKKATYVIKVCSTGKGKITVQSVYYNDIEEYMPVSCIRDRGIQEFLDLDDMKETLNWNLNGDSAKYQFCWGMTVNGVSEGIAYVFCDYDQATKYYLKALIRIDRERPDSIMSQGQKDSIYYTLLGMVERHYTEADILDYVNNAKISI